MQLPDRPIASIYWTPTTAAHEVHGAIRVAWAQHGFELGPVGYPTSDEHDSSVRWTTQRVRARLHRLDPPAWRPGTRTSAHRRGHESTSGRQLSFFSSDPGAVRAAIVVIASLDPQPITDERLGLSRPSEAGDDGSRVEVRWTARRRTSKGPRRPVPATGILFQDGRISWRGCVSVHVTRLHSVHASARWVGSEFASLNRGPA